MVFANFFIIVKMSYTCMRVKKNMRQLKNGLGIIRLCLIERDNWHVLTVVAERFSCKRPNVR